MRKYFLSLNEFLATKPAPSPVKPTTKPEPKPSRPSPIRRDKPSVDPKPKAATEQDVVDRFFEELRKENKDVKIDLKKIKKRYEK